MRRYRATVHSSESVRHLLVEAGQGTDHTTGIVVEAHLYFVAYGWLAAMYFICLSEGGDFSSDRGCSGQGRSISQWQEVELLQLLCNAPSFEKHSTAGYFGRVCRENRYYLHPTQPFEGSSRADATVAHPFEGPAERAWLDGKFRS